jgi:hypothetical protein
MKFTVAQRNKWLKIYRLILAVLENNFRFRYFFCVNQFKKLYN